MRWKQLATVMMGTVLVFGSLPVSAIAKDNPNKDEQTGNFSTKDEAIYGNLGANGALKEMYVVNTFHDTKPGTITDHGNYTDVRNLSNLTDINQSDDDKVRFQTEKGDKDFYYQGALKNQPLPWNIDITYKLDGKKINPDKLAGKDGPLEIQIKTSGNKDADPAFFENYMMQISLTLDPVHFDKIQAPDATKAKSGKDTNLTFTVLPEKEETFIVSADVTDVEMDPIDISATPASMPMDDPDLGDMKGDIESLADAIKAINSGVGDLKNGISDLNDGAMELSDGSDSYLNGIQQLDQSSGKLVNGSSQMSDAFQQLSKAVQGAPDEAPDMSDFNQLPDGIREMANGLEQSADGLDELHDNYAMAYKKLDHAIGEIPDHDISESQIKKLLGSDADQEVVNQLLDTYKAAKKAKGTYEAVKEAFDAVTETLDDVSASIRKMADEANAMATEIESGLNDMDGLDELDDLQSGLSEFASQYQSFHQGLVKYTDGVSDLASNYQDIDTGIQGLAEGTDSLNDGTGELQDGTKELEDKTSDMPDEMQSEVDDMLDEYDASDFDPVSFVSDKNKDIDVVQFVLKTDPIEAEEPDTTDDTDQEEDKGFWDRLLDLFR
ncbi:YhgE/Pip domain-containing protein [Lentibacillus sp. N15]|uniref:YhgE/Pip domain-containing protein n=1 Tax=Lentibacillus songyuanensis TaxID=3136161 RepID=UPI0031BAD58D